VSGHFDLPEVIETNMGNVIMKPVTGTLHHLPWAADGKFKVGEILCESFWTKPYRDGGPQEACPRFVARKQLEQLDELGFKLFSSYEAEFIVFQQDTKQTLFQGYQVFSALQLSQCESFIYSLASALSQVGIDVETLDLENTPGQFEFSMKPTFGITSPDSMFRLKQCIKEKCLQQDLIATFMTKPVENIGSNGLHYNHSLWTKASNENAFYDGAQPDGLSAIAKHWIAGLIKHARAIRALCCPTVNCYRRLLKQMIPDKPNWGIDNRICSFRAKNLSHQETYVENRIPSGSANPYLVVAATVAAGISGIRNKLECPLSNQETDRLLPRNLSEALDALEQDDVIVSALGEEFVRWFVDIKRRLEIDELKDDDIEQETTMYLKNL
jgi:glutamine synthetase